MIKILQNWEEIGQASKYLSLRELPRHRTSEKDWDLFHLQAVSSSLDRGARIVDLGCSGAHSLKLLWAMGFENLCGVDLHIGIPDRCSQLVRMWRSRTFKRPFKLYRQDLANTRFAADSFDLAMCVSVIEHGVDSEKFLRESNRILKTGGILFVSADYWQEPIDVSDVPKQFGQEWKIFCREDVEGFLELAGRYGFELYEDSAIPSCGNRCLVWQKKEFTAIAIALRKIG
jgi:SAM-dependent methyltransferase